MPALTRADLQRRALANGTSLEFDDGDVFNAGQSAVPVIGRRPPDPTDGNSQGSDVAAAIIEMGQAILAGNQALAATIAAAALAKPSAPEPMAMPSHGPMTEPCAYTISGVTRNSDGFLKGAVLQCEGMPGYVLGEIKRDRRGLLQEAVLTPDAPDAVGYRISFTKRDDDGDFSDAVFTPLT